jgi:hypothetical protein
VGEVGSRWRRFIQALRSVLAGRLPEHRHQDQFIQVRDAALDLAESDAAVGEIDRAYGEVARPSPDGNKSAPATGEAADIVVREMESYVAAVGVHELEAKAGTAKSGALKELANAAKTILGSVGDVFKLSDYGKGIITVVKEAAELFGGA